MTARPLRVVFALLAVALVATCGGCFEPAFTTCTRDGVAIICPSSMVCAADNTCVTASQVEACAGLASGATCAAGSTAGLCHGGACVASLDLCGDGVASVLLGELCDCGDPQYLVMPAAGCAGFNSRDPGASCRPDCQPARCGDGIVDPAERCDDGNTISGDGCAGDCSGQFAEMETPQAFTFFSGWMFAPDDIYALGADTFIHYDGATWTTMPTTSSYSGRVMWASSSTDVWTNANGGISHFDGIGWSTYAIANASIYGIWGRSATDVYAYGNAFPNGSFLWHYDGTTWTQGAIPAGCPSLAPRAMWGQGANIFVAGETVCVGTSATQWRQIDTVMANALTGAGDHLFELTQDGDLVDLDIVTGVRIAHVVPGTLQAITATGTGANAKVIGVGGFGVVLEYDVASDSWTHPVTPTTLDLWAVVASSPMNVFVFGANGLVLH